LWFRKEISSGDSKDIADREDVGRHADESGGATVESGGGLVVTRG
jgi:hypothetical protein